MGDYFTSTTIMKDAVESQLRSALYTLHIDRSQTREKLQKNPVEFIDFFLSSPNELVL